MTIRLANHADLFAISDIYNHYVVHSTATYQLEPEVIATRVKWFETHGAKHPITVAVVDDAVVGWGSLSRFHPRSAYDGTVENSVYVHHAHHRRGVGRAILADLIGRAKALGHHTIIGLISADQEPSVRLHSAFGFVEAAHLKQVGFKFDRWLDVVYMQLML